MEDVKIPGGATQTSYIDENDEKQTGYIINGSTYTDPEGKTSVGVGSRVTTGDGQEYIKTGSGSMLYSDYLKNSGITPTTYKDSGGNDLSGYIKNGTTYTDVFAQNPISVGSRVTTGDGKEYIKTDSGSMLYSDYLQQQEQQTNNAGALQEMLTQYQTALDQALAANDTVYAAQLQQNINNIQSQIDELNQSYKNLNKQLYVDYMNSKKNLPQQLSAMGYNGGLAESSLLGLETGYQGNLNANEQQRISGVKSLESGITDAQLETAIAKAQADQSAQDNYTTRYAAVLQAMQEQENYEKEVERETAANEYTMALQKAQTLAAAGDFSGYKALGYTDAQIATMQGTIETAGAGSGAGTGTSDWSAVEQYVAKGGSADDYIAANYKALGYSSATVAKAAYKVYRGESAWDTAVTNLNYGEDEGIFSWNGKTYRNVETLAKDIEAAELTDEQKAKLASKFAIFGFDVAF